MNRTVRGVIGNAVFTGSSTSGRLYEAGVGLGEFESDATSTSGTMITTDSDPGQSGFLAPTASSLRGSYGLFTFNTTVGSVDYGQWTYVLNNAKANSIAGPEEKSDILKITTLDGTLTQVQVTIYGTNDAPTIAGHANKTLSETGYNYIGNSTSMVKFKIADPDHLDHANWVLPTTYGWSLDTGSTYTKEGVYGYASFDTSTGKVIYTLDNSKAATNALETGDKFTDSFAVKVTDDYGATTTGSADFTIKGRNDAPYVDPDPLAAPELAYTKNTVAHFTPLQLLDNFLDPEGDSLTIAKVISGTGGKATLDAGTHAVTFKPDKDFEGEAHFWYVVSDGHGTAKSTPEYVTVHVAGGAGDAGGGGSGATPPTQIVTIDSMTHDSSVGPSTVRDFITNEGDDGRIINGRINAPLTANQFLQVSFDNGSNWQIASFGTDPTKWSVVDNTGAHSIDWTIVAHVTDIVSTLSGDDAVQPVTYDNLAPDSPTATVDNTQLVLSYQDSSKLDDAASPAGSAFSVKINGEDTAVDLVTIDAIAHTVTLTLAKGAGETSFVSIDYTGNAGIRDIAGNEAIDFSISQVVNTTLATSYNAIVGNLVGVTAPDNNDAIQGTTGNDYITGLTGNDSIDGNGGHDKISGNEGDDRIIVPDPYFDNIDGGDGNDTLALSGSDLDLNLTLLASRIHNIEVIDLTGSGDNSLSLRAVDLDAVSSNHILIVDGDLGDHVTLRQTASGPWTQGDDTTDPITGDVTYYSWLKDDVTLLVGVNVSLSNSSPPQMM